MRNLNRLKLFFYEKIHFQERSPHRFLHISTRSSHTFCFSLFFFPFFHNKWKIIRYDRLASIIAIIKNQGICLSNKRAVLYVPHHRDRNTDLDLPETERFRTSRPFCTKVVHLQIASVNCSTSETEV